MRRLVFAIVLVTAVGVAAPASAAAPHSSTTPHRSSTAPHRGAPIHKLTHGTSTNWAGYAAINSAFTSVSSSWTQPTATCTSQTTYSSFWVGLDGYNSNSVEQTGTDADCSGGQASYYAWYEMYPKFPVNLSTSTYPVRPGDQMHASVNFSGRNAFTLKISNTTRGWTFNTTQKSKAQRTSAEVIAEAPSSSGGVLALTNFGTANFGASNANGQSLASYRPDKIDMVSGGIVKAQTGSIATNGSFSVTWKHS
jgi:Peptidase A4 family